MYQNTHTSEETLTSDHNQVLMENRLLSTLRHSIKQALIPGNDWRRELKLIENLLNDVEALIPLKGGQTPQELRDFLSGMEVQVIGEHNSTNGYFGVVAEVLDHHGKNGAIIRVTDADMKKDDS